MCLSTVYKAMPGENILLCKNIAKVESLGDKLVFTDILGKQTVLNGSIINIDLMENIIKVREGD